MPLALFQRGPARAVTKWNGPIEALRRGIVRPSEHINVEQLPGGKVRLTLTPAGRAFVSKSISSGPPAARTLVSPRGSGGMLRRFIYGPAQSIAKYNAIIDLFNQGVIAESEHVVPLVQPDGTILLALR